MDKRQQKHRSREIRRRILTWIGMAKEPLRVDELAFVCAVGDGEEKIDLAQRLLYSEQDIWAKCGSLVEIVDGVVQYSHLSVREYLFRSRSGDYWVQEENAHASIALTSNKILPSFSAVSCISPQIRPSIMLSILTDWCNGASYAIEKQQFTSCKIRLGRTLPICRKLASPCFYCYN